MTEDDQHAIDTAFVNIGKAIAAYEHRLVSGPSPFDLYVRAMVSNDRAGMAAYPEAARRGLLLFVGEAGCRQCHSGPMLSDLEFHNIGVPSLDGTLPDDPGRFEGIRTLQQNPFRANGHFSDEPDSIRARSTQTLLQSSEHWGAFRTPSLRNVARTPPYMHQGQFKTLGEVLAYYNTLDDMVVLDHHQEAVLVPLRLEPQALADLEAFLESLSSPPVEAALGQTTPEIPKKPVPDP
jgi:cytochrome c peroxidase